jgi:ligand-binding SRPBCC domain-containing protein
MTRRPIGDLAYFAFSGMSWIRRSDGHLHATKIHTLQSEVWVPSPREGVFAFFSRAENLEALTPHWLHLSIVSPSPIEMKTGTRIRYRLRLHGIPLRWESEITAWEPPHRFVDEQRTGPYRLWIHEHLFLEQEGGTTVRDTVQYSVAGGELVHRLFVAPDLNKIFEFRRQRVAEVFWQTSGPAV